KSQTAAVVRIQILDQNSTSHQFLSLLRHRLALVIERKVGGVPHLCQQHLLEKSGRLWRLPFKVGNTTGLFHALVDARLKEQGDKVGPAGIQFGSLVQVVQGSAREAHVTRKQSLEPLGESPVDGQARLQRLKFRNELGVLRFREVLRT